MSNELLRIHDENNNCDLVAVANPMGNFHMSTYAEMEDGTQKPVDGWYLFSKMIEQIGSGGGESAGDGYDAIILEGDTGYSILKGSLDDCLSKHESNGALRIAMRNNQINSIKECVYYSVYNNAIFMKFLSFGGSGAHEDRFYWSNEYVGADD